MQKVRIFGDSYSSAEHHANFQWPVRLASKYNVRNWSWGGTGPEYMINIFRQELESKNVIVDELKDINLIFFISRDSRKDFSFITNPSDQCCMNRIGNWDKRLNKKYRKHKSFIDNFYRHYYIHNNLCDFNHLKYVGIIKEFSRFFKKVLVVSVFDRPEESLLLTKFNTRLENTENFTYAKGPALFFVEKEVNGDEPNHLCLENHNIMYNELSNWIEHDIPFDTKKLKKIS